ncbi:O-methyltransferase [Saccharopolyspora gregorii]|uniref:O-methyltransferase n=1 Tax=Saccharopolyspora gregorii TaxID=33914 RepID=UPI0021AD030E|nr:class I SAM-dependent methyltransferase [Saccharopolyspora gregorii]
MIPETSIGTGPLDRPGSMLGDARGSIGHAADPAEESIDGSAGAALRFLATVLRAKSVVEVGSGTGASASWLLRGMVPEGVLTSIDIDAAAQHIAREALAAQGVPRSRTRFIAGLAERVLPKLTEGAYDLVFVDAMPAKYPAFLELGAPLLRPGGAIVFAGPVDAAQRQEPRAQALRELTRAVRADESLVPVALPVGDGLLAIARTEQS